MYLNIDHAQIQHFFSGGPNFKFLSRWGPKLNFRQCQHKNREFTFHFENSKWGPDPLSPHLDPHVLTDAYDINFISHYFVYFR